VVEVKSGRTFLTAQKNADSLNLFTARSATWLNGSEIRPGVAYMLAPGSTVSFGAEAAAAGGVGFTVQTPEEKSAASPLMQMMMQNLAQSDEVKKRLE
jgi:hypothetical protein